MRRFSHIHLSLLALAVTGVSTAALAQAASQDDTARVEAAQTRRVAAEAEKTAAESEKTAAQAGLAAAKTAADLAEQHKKVAADVEKAEAENRRLALAATQQRKAAIEADLELAQKAVALAQARKTAADLEASAVATQLETRGKTLAQGLDNRRWADKTGDQIGSFITQSVGRRGLALRYGRACSNLQAGARYVFPIAGKERERTQGVVDDLRNFAECYRDKASGRQKWRDVAAVTTSVSTLALLIGNTKMAESSRIGWAAGAVLPLLATNLRGSTYEVQLYQAVSIAMDRTAERYAALDVRWAQVGEDWAPPTLPRAQAPLALTACDDADKAVVAAQSVASGSRRTIVEGVAQQAFDRCKAALRAQALVEDLQTAAMIEQRLLSDRAIQDGIDIAVRADTLDRAFRASPFQAFRTSAGAPFAIAQDLIGGTGWTPRADPRSDRDSAYALTGRAAPELPAAPADLGVDGVATAVYRQAIDEMKGDGSGAKGETAKEKARVAKQAEAIDTGVKATEEAVSKAVLKINPRLKRVRILVAEEGRTAIAIDPRQIDAASDVLTEDAEAKAKAKATTTTSTTTTTTAAAGT